MCTVSVVISGLIIEKQNWTFNHFSYVYSTVALNQCHETSFLLKIANGKKKNVCDDNLYKMSSHTFLYFLHGSHCWKITWPRAHKYLLKFSWSYTLYSPHLTCRYQVPLSNALQSLLGVSTILFINCDIWYSHDNIMTFLLFQVVVGS